MKFLFFSILFAISFSSSSQLLKKRANIQIVSFKDTIVTEPDATIKFKLVNTGDSPLVIKKYPDIALKMILLNGESIDTLPLGGKIESIDFCHGIPEGYFSKSTLKPGDSIDLQYGLNYLGYLGHGFGRVKLQVIYDLHELNKNCLDAESEWIIQYCPKIY